MKSALFMASCVISLGTLVSCSVGLYPLDGKSPTAQADLALVEANSVVNIDVLDNDRSTIEGSLRVSDVTAPMHGTAVVQDDLVRYTPTPGYSGLDAFYYSAADARSVTTTALVTVGVYPTPTAFTWTGGGGDDNWSTGANWFGGSPPGAGDIAVLGGACGFGCNISIDQSITVAGLVMHSSLFFGTVTQLTGNSITVGTSGFLQSTGTFLGGDSAILVQGSLTVDGGTFQATSNETTVGQLVSDTATVFRFSGDEFRHNNGTFSITNVATTCEDVFTAELNRPVAFNNLFVSANENGVCGPGSPVSFTGSGSPVTASNVTLFEGYIGGTTTIEVSGDITFTAAADGGEGNLKLTGSAPQTITGAAGGFLPRLEISKSGGTVSPSGGTTQIGATSLLITSGTFSAPATLVLTGGASNTIVLGRTGGTFIHNNGLVEVSGGYDCEHTFLMPGTGLTLFDLELELNEHNNCGTDGFLNMLNSTITVQNDLHLINGIYNNGTMNVGGQIEYEDGANSGSVILRLNGTVDQEITGTAAGFLPRVEIVKTSGVVRAAGGTTDINMATLTLTSGLFEAPATTRLSGGVVGLRLIDQTGGTFQHNSGLLTLMGGWDCVHYGYLALNGLTLYDLEIDLLEHSNCGTDGDLYLQGGTLAVANNVNLVNGWLWNGTIDIGGNLTIQNTFAGGDVTSAFSGGAQTYQNLGGGDFSGAVTVESTSTLQFLTGATFTGTVTVDGGTVDRNGQTVNATFNLINGGQVIN